MSNGFSKVSSDARAVYMQTLPLAASGAPLPVGGESSDENETRELASSRGEEEPIVSRGDLIATIHRKIVPHLIRSHTLRSSEGRASSSVPCAAPSAVEATECARLAVASDVAGILRFVEGLTARGMSLESVFLDVIGAASRQLGDAWGADHLGFTEVTVGLGALHQVVGILGPSFSPPASQRGFVVLVAVPGEQHTLGLLLLGEFLRRAGWGVHVAPTMTEGELLALVEAEKVDLVGITVSNAGLLKALGKLVGAVKKATRNPSMLVMLGGSLELSGVAPKLGATFCADPREAVRWLDHHVDVSKSAATC
jgi:methanogenic corrinoid protein MtbC1